MNYSLFLGLLVNLDISWQGWSFLFIVFEVITISFIVFLALNKHSFKKNDINNKSKILLLMFTFLIVLALVGIIGFSIFLLTYLITTSFLSDYRVGE